MIKRRGVLTAIPLLVLVLSIGLQGSVLAATSVEDLGFRISEGMDSAGAPMTNLRADEKSGVRGFVCNSTMDPKCVGKTLVASMYLIPCSDSSTVGCINEVYALGPDGSRVNAEFIRSVAKVANLTFEENPALRLAAGEGMGGLWRFPGLSHGGNTDLYAVQARLTGQNYQEQPLMKYENFQVGIAAVSEGPTEFNDPIIGINNEGRWQGGFSFDIKCVMQERKVCFNRTSFPKSYRFGIEVRLPNSLSLGWFHGRFAKPEFSVAPDSNSSFRYRVEADPVIVPELIDKTPSSSWTSEFRDYAREQWPLSNGNGYMVPGVMGKLPMELARRYLPIVKDKATASASFWVARSLNEFADGKISEAIDPQVLKCTPNDGSIAGLVTTNAMVYTQGPPEFNADNQSLDYKVLSPHFDETGKENLGTYDLLIDSTVARCIYGFSKAPIKAELEIIGGDGTAKVATTVLGERGGWLFLSANGFSYSNPTIRVKLSQEKVSESAPSPTPTPTTTPTPAATPIPTTSPAPVGSSEASPAPSTIQGATANPVKNPAMAIKKVFSINCKKGNQLKVISGKSKSKLSCPKGWKIA